MINNRFKIQHQLGKGSFATVFCGSDTKLSTQVAIKLVEASLSTSCIIEGKVLKCVSGMPHFPRLFWNGEYGKCYCFVMELLGPSLTEIIKDKQLGLESILELGIQMITTLESLHGIGYIHRDIKPDNILAGINSPEFFYLVDFGLSRNFIDSSNKHHTPMREETFFKGNLVFCSKNILSGVSASRRDDIESLLLLLIYLIKKELPWIKERKNLERMIGRRCSVNFGQFMQGLPIEIMEVYNYAQSLSYYQTPNYSWVKEKLIQIKEKVATSLLYGINPKQFEMKNKLKRAKTAGAKSKTIIFDIETRVISPPHFSKKFRKKVLKLRNKSIQIIVN